MPISMPVPIILPGITPADPAVGAATIAPIALLNSITPTAQTIDVFISPASIRLPFSFAFTIL